MPFIGTYEHTIDSKNRLSIPAAIRAAMDPDREGDKFLLAPVGRTSVLSLIGNRRYSQLASARRRNRLPIEDDLVYDRLFYANSATLEFDAQGRVLIPELFLRRAGIGREVTILGVNDHVEIWDRQEYAKFLEQEWARFEEIQRRAMKDSSASDSQPWPDAGN